MRSMLAPALFATIGVCAAPALSQPASPPRYDPAGWCQRVAETGGGSSEWLRGACLQQEQSAYDKLKAQWAGVPGKTRQWCDQVAKSGGRGSYVLLEQCLDMEHFSKKRNDNSTFRF